MCVRVCVALRLFGCVCLFGCVGLYRAGVSGVYACVARIASECTRAVSPLSANRVPTYACPQTADLSPGGGVDVVSTAWQLVTNRPVPGSAVYLGASRGPSASSYLGWTWVDGTPASANLGCSTLGCSLLGPTEPKYAATHSPGAARAQSTVPT